MDKMNFLIDQIVETRNFTNRLISETPQDLWYVIPENTNSNFAWQLGHLLVAQNFHTLTAVTGVNSEVVAQMPIHLYNRVFYGMGTGQRSVGEEVVSPGLLLEQLERVYEICLASLSLLTDEVLELPLQPLPFTHPVAATRYEALAWSFKHEMWHCAEMEEIKRKLDCPVVW
ncbi:MAG: DinB family protein, partial [Tannerellaceae bacterium]|nr:DinB family protein [Tannerellaceae bacterium]